MMLPPVLATLRAVPAVLAILGNPPRIYRNGEAPQDTTRPYATWFIATGTPENNISDLPGIDRQSIQIDCWHQTDAGIEALARAVRDAIEPHAHMTAVIANEREKETRLYRVGMQFDWFLRR